MSWSEKMFSNIIFDILSSLNYYINESLTMIHEKLQITVLVTMKATALKIISTNTYITTPFPHHEIIPRIVIKDPSEIFQKVDSGGY